MLKRTIFICLVSLLILTPHHTTTATTSGDAYTIHLPLIIHYNNLGPNRLPNASFEGGWYHPNGIAELQIPDDWTFAWDTGPTGYGSEPWDVWVRPEVRVLPSEQLPPAEHELFIWDGNQTLKIFKGWGAISYRLTTNVTLVPGTYLLEINLFPDLVDHYDNGQKVWAEDPLAGEVRFLIDGQATNWILPTFGQQNRLLHTFTITETRTISVGVHIRGRYALLNNGWFMDAWSLRQLGVTD